MQTPANPLLDDWAPPFALPPFERVEARHFPPAFEHAMRQHRAELAAITADPRRFSIAATKGFVAVGADATPEVAGRDAPSRASA